MTETPDEGVNRDFRHLLNLDELHDRVFQHRRVQIKRNSSYLAKLFLSNGIFFTNRRSVNIPKIRSRLGADPFTATIGKVIGAHIGGTQVTGGDQVTVRVNSQDIHLARDADSPYIVVIRYKCVERETNSETDFQRFHNVLDLDANDVLDIFYDQIEPADPIRCEELLERAFNEKRLSEEAYKDESLRLLVESFRRAEEACQATTKPECPNNLAGRSENCP